VGDPQVEVPELDRLFIIFLAYVYINICLMPLK